LPGATLNKPFRRRHQMMEVSRALKVACAGGLFVGIVGIMTNTASAGPSAENARRCMKSSYLAYPYKRPGSVRMSGDRQAYFKDCMAKEGNIPAPEPASPKS
jgi:hypothetical protein